MSQDHGRVIWNELNTRDVEGAKAYYSAVCGWTFDSRPVSGGDGDYVIGKLGDQMVAGFFDITGMAELDQVPAHWLAYIGVDDVDAACAATKAAGGQVIREPFDVPEAGRIAIVQDPTGGVFGIMTSGDG